jgi:MoaA/NifB/PqqE/SkfB family radical SAM enzyme
MPSPWATHDERLLNVQWEITERCNLRCGHCYVTLADRLGARAAQELSFEESLAVLDDLITLGAMFVTFTGGEVLVHDRFFDLCAEARHRGFGVRVLTNGTRIGEAEAERLAELGVLSVEMTLYAGSAEGYKRATGEREGLDEILTAVRALKKRLVPVVLKAFYFKGNADEVEAMEQIATNEGFVLERGMSLMPRHQESKVPLKAGVTRKQLARIGRTIGEPNLAAAYDDIQFATLCGRCGRNRLFISASGDVSPCNSMRSVVLGNVRQERLTSIWRNACTQGKIKQLPAPSTRIPLIPISPSRSSYRKEI